MKTKKNSRKFYNKWLYKISLKLEGASAFRIYTLEQLKKICLNENTGTTGDRFLDSLRNSRAEYLDLIEIFEQLDPKEWSKRIERSLIDIYTNDQTVYNTVSEKFQNIIKQRFEPQEGSEDLLDDIGIIVTKKYPHKRYRFKVFLLPHKLAREYEAKQRYVNWIKTQTPRITCTPAVENWFIRTDWNWDRRYVLVEDENTLLLMKLRNSEVIGRVYKYVISDK
jgi:hypothetical protein